MPSLQKLRTDLSTAGNRGSMLTQVAGNERDITMFGELQQYDLIKVEDDPIVKMVAGVETHTVSRQLRNVLRTHRPLPGSLNAVGLQGVSMHTNSSWEPSSQRPLICWIPFVLFPASPKQ